MGETVLLAHGSGSKLSHDLIEQKLLGPLNNPLLAKMDDSAVFNSTGKLAFTTDSYVVKPIFFPGGDIGKLSICGTVNDLSMSGASPLYLSLALIIEEGLAFEVLERVINSIKITAEEAQVSIITGDTKVVDRGSADKLFINTSGIGIISDGIDISGANARVGDKIIVSGTIGDHGIAVLSQREGLKFNTAIESDCAPLNTLITKILKVSRNVHCFRDPTRGGLATTLNEIAKQSNIGISIEEEKIPVNEGVLAVCELLGLDPLYIANEGKLIAIVAAEDADKILAEMRRHRYGEKAQIVGEVTVDHAGKVVMKTRIGSRRIVDMLTGELLPRIC